MPTKIPEKWAGLFGASLALSLKVAADAGTPRPGRIDVSAADLLRAFAEQNSGNHAGVPYGWRRNGRTAIEHGGVFPQGFFRCRDGFMAVQARSRHAANLWSLWSSHKEWIERAEQALVEVNLAGQRDTIAAALPHGDKRKLEVALLMALEPRVFMFDEPTAGMSVDEVPVILDLIAKLKARGDKTILLVEHKMDVVRSLADRIIVLLNGTLSADGDPAEVTASAAVQEAYLGVAPKKAGG